MRRLMIAGWLLLPVGAWAYHEGPGQDQMSLDTVDQLVAEAHDAALAEEWAEAVEKYDQALLELPSDRVGTARQIRLELNKARMLSAKRHRIRTVLLALSRFLRVQPSKGRKGLMVLILRFLGYLF